MMLVAFPNVTVGQDSEVESAPHSETSTTDVQIQESLISQIDALVEQTLAAEPTPSYAIGIIKDGNTLLAKGYGLADVEHQVPATEKTVYRIGSVTKPFTAMAVMQLAAQGKLAVTDEITKHLPDIPLQGNQVTLRHLLQHTSGLQSYTAQPELLKWIAALDAERFLSSQAYEEMYTPITLSDGTSHPYGWSWFVGRPQVDFAWRFD